VPQQQPQHFLQVVSANKIAGFVLLKPGVDVIRFAKCKLQTLEHITAAAWKYANAVKLPCVRGHCCLILLQNA
jgi:hypothetical protein